MAGSKAVGEFEQIDLTTTRGHRVLTDAPARCACELENQVGQAIMYC